MIFQNLPEAIFLKTFFANAQATPDLEGEQLAIGN
jgi:hypothetical protein